MPALLPALKTLFSHSETCICITGSGGKTTALIGLARLFALEGKRVLVSTTTKLQLPSQRAYGCDRYFFDDEVLTYAPHQGERVFYALKGEEKALSPDVKTLHQLAEHYDVLLLEADGARGCELKLHTERDPVIPSFSTATLAIASVGALGKPLSKACFGWDEGDDQPVTAETLSFLLSHPQGICKGMQGTAVVLLNQADVLTKQQRKDLQNLECRHTLILGSLAKNILYEKD